MASKLDVLTLIIVGVALLFFAQRGLHQKAPAFAPSVAQVREAPKPARETQLRLNCLANRPQGLIARPDELVLPYSGAQAITGEQVVCHEAQRMAGSSGR